MKSLSGFIRSQYYKIAKGRLHREVAARKTGISLERANWPQSMREPNLFYYECLRYFYQELPPGIRDHRNYFCENGRGFGEHPFHVMWYLLVREFKPAYFLEIGIFRGQTISLIALLSRQFRNSCQVYGISPFSPAGDSVSKYRADVDYYTDTLANFDHFGLLRPNLLRAFSTDPAAQELITSIQWDLIYIDGNHDYDIARKDWEICARSVRLGGCIVLDDSGLTTSYQPPHYDGSRGHPGPSRLAQEIDRTRFQEILQVGHNRVFQKR